MKEGVSEQRNGERSENPADGETSPDWEWPEQKYHLPSSESYEDLERYEPGGFHPVHLGDVYHEGRYRVVHKLGFGGFSTVWLALDQSLERYVALKVVAAEDSENYQGLSRHQDLIAQNHDQTDLEFVSSLLSHFWHDGPNGRHLCLVSPVLGPSISQMSGFTCRLFPAFAQEVAIQATRAMSYLHS